MKKILSIILSCVLLSMVTTVFAAYGEHVHKLIKKTNISSHFEECQVCFEYFDVGDHTFKDGKCTVCGYPELVNPFVDVPEDAWYYDEVVEAVYTGVINGKSATEFKPDDHLTYAEAIKLAACMNQLYTEGKVTLKNGDPWYVTYVDYCFDNDIIDEEYNYDNYATRSGYMVIFAHALPDEAFEVINNVPDGSIPDVPVSAEYASEVYKLYRAGILQGSDEQHSCKPFDNIKRSEVAAIISRMMDSDKRIKFDMSGDTLENKGTIDDKVDEGDVTTTTTVIPESPEVTEKIPTQTVTPGISVTPTKPVEGSGQPIADTPLTIHKQPQGSDCAEYGSKYELEVQVFGGKAPYTYEWQYNGYRNQKTKIENGDYVKDADSAALILSVEKENTLLGAAISCKITDSEGKTVTTETVKVYGPFSMTVDDWTLESGKNTLIGKVSDGILKKGEKISVIRNGKVIATGVAEDLQMFNKSLDETAKGDNVGIVFNKEKGVLPSKGDIVVKYQPSHVVDTSDVIN